MLAIDAGRIGSLLYLHYMLDGLRACCACNRCWMDWHPAIFAVYAGWIKSLLSWQEMLDGLAACYVNSICWRD